MKRFVIAFLLASLCCAAGAGPSLAGQAVTKPYYYLGAGRTLSTLDQQRLTVYRDQLQAQQRAQELQLYQGGVGLGNRGSVIGVPNPSGPLRPFANPAVAGSNLYQTQSELGRVNGLLNTSRTTQMLTIPPAMVVKPFKTP